MKRTMTAEKTVAWWKWHSSKIGCEIITAVTESNSVGWSSSVNDPCPAKDIVCFPQTMSTESGHYWCPPNVEPDWIREGWAWDGAERKITKIEEYTKLVIPQSSKCDCGAEKARTTHADWCSTQ